MKTPSAKSRLFFADGKGQTLGEAVLNLPQGQCRPCNAAGRKKAALQQAGQ